MSNAMPIPDSFAWSGVAPIAPLPAVPIAAAGEVSDDVESEGERETLATLLGAPGPRRLLTSRRTQVLEAHLGVAQRSVY